MLLRLTLIGSKRLHALDEDSRLLLIDEMVYTAHTTLTTALTDSITEFTITNTYGLSMKSIDGMIEQLRYQLSPTITRRGSLSVMTYNGSVLILRFEEIL
jgi:hypothetical protein